MMESSKIIVFDLDQTLAESKMPLDPEMADLLKRLIKIRKVAVISGASLDQFRKQFLQYLNCQESDLKNLYLMPTGGAVLYKYEKDWISVYRYDFSKEDKKKITDAFEDTFRETDYKNPDKIFGELIQDRDSSMTFSALGNDAPFELKEHWDSDQKKRTILVEKLSSKLPDFSVKIGGTTSIDITKRGIDKAFGVLELMKFLGYNKSDVFYVGDAFYPQGNDTSIISTGIRYEWVKGGVKDTKKLLSEFLLK